MEKMLGNITSILMIVAVIILIIWYLQMIKSTKESIVRQKERDEQEKEINKLLYESQVDINNRIKSGEIKIHADKGCGCHDKKKSTEKKTTTKKKSHAKV